MNLSFHASTFSPQEFGKNFLPLTHFGDIRLGITQCLRNVRSWQTVGGRPCNEVFVYQTEISEGKTLNVEDFGSPSAIALANHLAWIGDMAGEKLFPNLPKEFCARGFTKVSGYRGKPSDTEDGREFVAESIKEKGFKSVTYTNKNEIEIRGITILDEFIRNSLPEHVFGADSNICYMNLYRYKANLYCTLKTEELMSHFPSEFFR